MPLNDIDFYQAITTYCVKNEMTYHLDDLIYRRIFPNNVAPISPELLIALAEEMSNLLDWSTEEKEREIAQVINKQEACL